MSYAISTLNPQAGSTLMENGADLHSNQKDAVDAAVMKGRVDAERILTPVDLKKLYERLPWPSFAASPYSLAAIGMLLLTGCRVSELLTLSWEDVDLENGCFYLKARPAGRWIAPLSDKAKQILASLPRREGSLYIFLGPYPKTHYRDIRKTWRYLCALAGVPCIQLRDLRHSFAALALAQGVDMATALEILGERRQLGTKRFVPLGLRHLRKAANRIAQAFE